MSAIDAKEELGGLLSLICDGKCKYPDKLTGEELDEMCDSCPMTAIVDLFSEALRNDEDY